ncbi:adenosine deaminase [Candidatus Saccharibacteria bacterium]|nr:adenosine deaminase [Candidatus Saccharibacteria bacterium]
MNKHKSSWKKVDYDQYETFKRLSELVEKNGFTKDNPAIPEIAEYFFGFMTPEGDIRGIYGNQTSPNYTAAILELLIKAGYEKDSRVKQSLDWLLSNRQSDGGWALAFRTKGHNLESFDYDETIEGDPSKPSSAMITGVVLRALVAHPKYKNRPETKAAATLVADSIFTPDAYADRKGAEYWTRFGYPFVYTDLISALDSLSQIEGFSNHPKVKEGLAWLASRQAPDGMFDLRTTRGKKEDQKLWLSLAVNRIFDRFAAQD